MTHSTHSHAVRNGVGGCCGSELVLGGSELLDGGSVDSPEVFSAGMGFSSATREPVDWRLFYASTKWEIRAIAEAMMAIRLPTRSQAQRRTVRGGVHALSS